MRDKSHYLASKTMKLTMHEDMEYTKHFHLEITGRDYVKAMFDEWDLRVLEDCNSEDATISDKLLGLELIARRIEQASQKSAAQTRIKTKIKR